MKDNVVVVKEGGKVFWFCGSCGRPLAKTKGTTLACPRGHVKTAEGYKLQVERKLYFQMELDFTGKPKKTQKSRKGVKSGL